MLQRRGFLTALLAAPLIVRPGILMPVKPQFILWGDGIHDDTPALQALLDGQHNNVTIHNNCAVAYKQGNAIIFCGNGNFLVHSTLSIKSATSIQMSGGRYIVESPDTNFTANWNYITDQKV